MGKLRVRLVRALAREIYGQADTHELSCKRLGQMLAIGRQQTDSFSLAPSYCLDDRIGYAENPLQVDHLVVELMTVKLTLANEVCTYGTASYEIPPTILLAKLGEQIHVGEVVESGTQDDRIRLLEIAEITRLCHYYYIEGWHVDV